MAELTQEQLLTYVDAAFSFYEKVTGYQPDVKQVQSLLQVAGIHETLEHIKMCGDIVLELEEYQPPEKDIDAPWTGDFDTMHS